MFATRLNKLMSPSNECGKYPLWRMLILRGGYDFEG
jgi:hypothetical protein